MRATYKSVDLQYKGGKLRNGGRRSELQRAGTCKPQFVVRFRSVQARWNVQEGPTRYMERCCCTRKIYWIRAMLFERHRGTIGRN